MRMSNVQVSLCCHYQENVCSLKLDGLSDCDAPTQDGNALAEGNDGSFTPGQVSSPPQACW